MTPTLRSGLLISLYMRALAQITFFIPLKTGLLYVLGFYVLMSVFLLVIIQLTNIKSGTISYYRIRTPAPMIKYQAFIGFVP